MLQLAIAVKEQDYVRRLADYVRDSPLGGEWRVTGFSTPIALRQYLKGGYQVDLLALQPEFLDQAGELLDSIPAVMFVKYPSAETDRPQVLQFQPLPLLLQELVSIYMNQGGRMLDNPAGKSGNPVIAAVYSAVGGLGKTTVALYLAQQAALNRKKVFYLNVELWNATGLFFGDEPEDSLPRMLYSLQSEPNDAGELFGKLKKYNPLLKIDYLPSAPHPDERMALTPLELNKLLDIIAANGNYDLIAVDLDSAFDELHAAVFERSSRIFWLTSNEPSVKRKTEIALQYGRQRWGEKFSAMERKIRFITNRQKEMDMFRESSLPYVPEWQASDQPAVLLSSSGFRGAVQSLIMTHIWKEAGHGGSYGGRDIEAAGAYPHPVRSERFRIGQPAKVDY